MPPKVEAVAEVFVFEKDRMMNKFNVENYTTRQRLMEEKSFYVPPRPIKNPADKLKERLHTYKNIRKMKTDYKNYVKKFGPPQFYVPEELWRTTDTS